MFLIINIIEVFVIMTGVFCLRRKGPAFLYFILLLTALAFINDAVIVVYSKAWWGIRRNVFYNLFSLVEISIWFFIYSRIFLNQSFIRQLSFFLWLLIICYSLIELFFTGSFNEFHINSYACFCITSVFFSFYYLQSMMKKEYHLLSADPAFWICAASICFNSIFFINLITEMNTDYWQRPGAKEVFHILQSAAIIIYHLFICTAFLTFYFKSRKTVLPAS